MLRKFTQLVQRNITQFEFSFDKEFCDGTAAAPNPGKLKGLALKTFAESDSQTGISEDVQAKDVRITIVRFPRH